MTLEMIQALLGKVQLQIRKDFESVKNDVGKLATSVEDQGERLLAVEKNQENVLQRWSKEGLRGQALLLRRGPWNRPSLESSLVDGTSVLERKTLSLKSSPSVPRSEEDTV